METGHPSTRAVNSGRQLGQWKPGFSSPIVSASLLCIRCLCRDLTLKISEVEVFLTALDVILTAGSGVESKLSSSLTNDMSLILTASKRGDRI